MEDTSASLRVFRADTGGSYMVTVAEGATVDHLRTALAEASEIAPADQILICDGSKMEPSKPLSSYDPSLGSKPDSPDPSPTSIFLFSRTDLDPSAGPPPPTVLLPGPILNPPTVPSQDIPPPSVPADAPPLLKAAAEFERALALAVTQADELAKAAGARNTVSRTCVAEQYVMVKALGAATTNLDGFNRQIGQAVDKSDAYFTAQAARHAELLEGFEDSMERLAATPVLPALVALSPPPYPKTVVAAAENASEDGDGEDGDADDSPATSLASWIPEDRLRKWAADCRIAHDSLQTKLKDLSASVDAVKQSVAQQMDRPSPIDDEANERLSKALEAGNLAVEAAFDDLAEVKELHASVTDAIASGSVKAEDIAIFESKRATAVNELLPKMIAADAAFYADVQCAVAAEKDKVAAEVSSRLHDVSAAQSRISDLGNRISLYTEAMSKQQVAFGQLVHVARMPKAYRAAVAEVVRRRAFGRMYRSQGDNIAEAMAKVAAEEHVKRERFHRKHGKYLPSTLIPGLGDRPPQAEVRVPPDFDVALPDLDISDVESSAGESLFVGSSTAESLNSGHAPSFLAGSSGIPSIGSGTTASSNQGGDSSAPAVSPEVAAETVAALQEARAANKDLEARIKSLEEALAASATKLREVSQEQSVLPTSPPASPLPDATNNAKVQELEEALEAKTKAAAEYAANNAHLEVVLSDMKTETAASQAALESARDALALVASIIDPSSETPSSDQMVVPDEHAELIKSLTDRIAADAAAAAAAAAAHPSSSSGSSSLTASSSATSSSVPPPPSASLTSPSSTTSSTSGQTPLIRPTTPMHTALRSAGVPTGISYSSFSDGDLALFFPTNGGAFIAFNINAPRHYLSKESVEVFLKADKSRPSYILGLIVHLEKCVSSGEKGGESDPFRLGPGVTYHIVTLAKVFT